MTATSGAGGAPARSVTQREAVGETLTGGEASILDLVRGFGVTVGPSFVLDVAGGTAVASMLRALARRRRPSLGAALGTALVAAYVAAIRPWMLRWGATSEETRKVLSGDELVANPGSQTTRAVTVDAPVEAVWPWLAQVGQDRAGFYSYEWLENLAGCQMHNANHVRPEWQERPIGETVYLHRLYGLPVARFERNRVLALKNWGAFVVEPLGGERTRLVARGRTARGPALLFYVLLIELPHFVMERKMLLGIKRRAERAFAGKAR